MRCGVVRTQRLYSVCVTSHTASSQRTTRYVLAVRTAPQQQKRLVVLFVIIFHTFFLFSLDFFYFMFYYYENLEIIII